MQVEITRTARRHLQGLPESLRRAALDSFQTLRALDRAGLEGHEGLGFERLEGQFDPGSGRPFWGFRFGKAARAVCILEDGPIVVVAAFEPDPGKGWV
jgi:hypothetical protein